MTSTGGVTGGYDYVGRPSAAVEPNEAEKKKDAANTDYTDYDPEVDGEGDDDGKVDGPVIVDLRGWARQADGSYHRPHPSGKGREVFVPVAGLTVWTDEGLMIDGRKLDEQTSEFNAGGGVKSRVNYFTGKTEYYAEYSSEKAVPGSKTPKTIERPIVGPQGFGRVFHHVRR